jgi:hypothetical protein
MAPYVVEIGIGLAKQGLQLTGKVWHLCSVFGWQNFASWQQNKSPSF